VVKLITAKAYGTAPDSAKQRRAELWNNLNRYIRECGGNVVSVPGGTPLRVEVAPNSGLCKTLANAGYSVCLGERVTRIGGPETFTVCDILWIDLPKVW
jgi:hypothetical protein